METGSFPPGQQQPSLLLFADGQWVCVCFPYKSWKHEKKNQTGLCCFLFLFR